MFALYSQDSPVVPSDLGAVSYLLANCAAPLLKGIICSSSWLKGSWFWFFSDPIIWITSLFCRASIQTLFFELFWWLAVGLWGQGANIVWLPVNGYTSVCILEANNCKQLQLMALYRLLNKNYWFFFPNYSSDNFSTVSRILLLLKIVYPIYCFREF